MAEATLHVMLKVIKVDLDDKVVECTTGGYMLTNIRSLKGKGRNVVTLSSLKIIRTFWLNPGTLGCGLPWIVQLSLIMSTMLRNQNKYQILWFPLDDPFTEQEKDVQRVVASFKIC
ncbi:hypothetical protein K488DRAFT_73340 [Vararia minispora EC-137]|uniref:Uncharacterized protein n=1 Tax=Vararia minispora EC-137 TaxID=1314806 RepID=A0ACB8QBJ8_9AGAM|nr:hypothetical protein K488DRAFT_73340 [Vararia minispora EC-137]